MSDNAFNAEELACFAEVRAKLIKDGVEERKIGGIEVRTGGVVGIRTAAAGCCSCAICCSTCCSSPSSSPSPSSISCSSSSSSC